MKSLNYLNNALAKLEARQRGADEALLLNARRHVAEASVANVFAVRDGALATPPPTDGALAGHHAPARCSSSRGELGIAAAERTLGRFDLLGADEVFLTGTGARIVPVALASTGARIGSGARARSRSALSRGLRRAARETARGTPLAAPRVPGATLGGCAGRRPSSPRCATIRPTPRR